MIHKYLVAAVSLGVMGSPLSAQSVRSGIDAWQRADYATAVANWRPLAEKGDADAAFNLGQAYRLGRGVPTNLAAAQTWFERAARKNHLDAQATLGLMLFESGDRSGGIRWLKIAAEKGEPRASLVYGTALFNGDGVKRDTVLGYAYVSRAAAQGLSPAKASLEELDNVMPLEQRKKGLLIAMAMADAVPPPVSRPAQPAPKPKTALAKTEKPAKAAQAAPPVAPKAAPVPVALSAPPVATGAGGGWRIQLGAFSQRGSAEALYKKLSPALAGRQPFYVSAGAVTRLQAGPYPTRAAAAAACAALHGQACFPVPAK